VPDSIVGLIIALAMVLPGFVIVQLSLVGRAQGESSEVELVLRALFYALFLHLIFSLWTGRLVEDVGPVDEWRHHLGALIPYVAVVLVIAPVALGSALGSYLRHVERTDDQPGLLYSALGARNASSSWDYLFQHQARYGSWVVIEYTDGALTGGKMGKTSPVGQTPTPHDIFVQELWTAKADDQGVVYLDEEITPIQGKWIADTQIRSVTILDPWYTKNEEAEGAKEQGQG
jgi:hypothetical protein